MQEMDRIQKCNEGYVILDVNEKAQIKGFKAYSNVKNIRQQMPCVNHGFQSSKTPQRQDEIREILSELGVSYLC